MGLLGSLFSAAADIAKETITETMNQKENEKFNKVIATIEKEIALVQEYKIALISESVTGKIDIRNYEIPILDEEETYEDIEEELDMVAEDGETMEIE